jgi:hypothetical protein
MNNFSKTGGNLNGNSYNALKETISPILSYAAISKQAKHPY